MKSTLAKNADKKDNSYINNEEESKGNKQKTSKSKIFLRTISKSMKSSSDGNEDESKKDSEKFREKELSDNQVHMYSICQSRS